MKQNILTIIGVAIIAVMLFFPLPKIMIYILFGVDAAVLVVTGFICIIQRIKGKKTLWLPRFVLFWTLATLSIVISVGRIILTTENQNMSASFFSKEPSNKNLIISIFVFLLLTAADFIQLGFCKKRLKDEWENIKDKGIKDEIEFYGNLDGSFKFLSGLLAFILFITVVIFLGRSLVDNTQFNLAMNIALKKNLILAMDISIIIQALITLCSFICSLCVDSKEENRMEV